MKKGKFLTALLACSMSVVAATACAFTVGCNKDNGNDDGGDNTGHVHQWATTWSHDDTNHWHACTAEGHTGAHKDVAPHVYDDDQDTTCNTCDYVRTVNGGGQEPDPGPGPAPSTKDPVIVNASTLSVGNLTDGQTLGTGVKIYGTPAVDANKKTITYKGDAIEITNRIKLSSKLTNGQTPMGIEVNVDTAATVIVYYYSGSTGQTRGLELYESDKTTVVAGSTTALSDGNVMATAMFNVSANTTYYIGASVAGVNVYYLAVVYGDVGETWTPHEEKAPACGVAGNTAYSESNYGRYKNSSDAYIMANAYTIAALTHNYSLKTDSITAPTATETGSATLTCANGHETPVELPVLSSDKYTARPEAGVSGTYTITVEGVQISFTAEGVTEAETTYTDVYKLENFAAVTVGNAKTEGQNCVYTGEGTAATIDGTTGALKCGNASDATKTYIALGTPITSGVVKITGTMAVISTNGSWTFFQLLNDDASSPKEFLGFRTGSKGVWGYRVDGSSNPAATPIAAATTMHTFEILVDLDGNKVSIKVDSTVLADNVDMVNTLATGFSSIMINCNAGRYVDIGSVTIATQD